MDGVLFSEDFMKMSGAKITLYPYFFPFFLNPFHSSRVLPILDRNCEIAQRLNQQLR